MRIIYDYPEDASDGDVFVVEDIDISPTTVTIHLKRYTPPYDHNARANAQAMEVADRLVSELQELPLPPGGWPGTFQLLVRAYETARRSNR